jgi:hypothetical protein
MHTGVWHFDDFFSQLIFLSLKASRRVGSSGSWLVVWRKAFGRLETKFLHHLVASDVRGAVDDRAERIFDLLAST